MIDLIKYFFENKEKLNDHYLKALKDIDIDKFKNDEYKVVDEQEIIDNWKLLVQPDYKVEDDSEFEWARFRFIICSFYLLDNNFFIQQHPDMLKRIQDFYKLSENELKQATVNKHGTKPNGDVAWGKRRLYINNLKFVKDYIEDEYNVNMFDKLKTGISVVGAFNEYVLEKQLGQGGNGVVWRAKDADNELHAIKFVGNKIDAKRKRFLNEIAFGFKVDHDNIIKISDFGQTKNMFFAVMPLYDCTLRDKLKEDLQPDDILKIFIGLITGLQFAHSHKVIHRDIKPENILFKNGSVNPVIADFGIAHFSEENLATDIMTKTIDRMGNFNYHAPEQKAGSKYNVTYSTDLFSTALILNQMFTGEIAQTADYKKISEINNNYAFLDNIFLDLYHTNPADRLYPEEKILLKIQMYIDKQPKLKNLESLDKQINNGFELNTFKINLVNSRYKDNKLYFIFDKDIEQRWYEILRSVPSGCAHQLSYPPSKLKFVHNLKNELYLDMPGAGKNTVTENINLARHWFPIATDLYNKEKTAIMQNELNILEIEKQELQNEIGREKEINDALQELF